MMYRLVERIASIEGAEAVVTGEIIGEHASQTLRNLRVENEVLKEFPVLRQLLDMNKVEVERLARKIGTFRYWHCRKMSLSQSVHFTRIH